MPEEETVKTFGDLTERWWMAFMIFVDLFSELYRDAQAYWQDAQAFTSWLWENFDLSWIDAADDAARRKDEDLTLHAAA